MKIRDSFDLLEEGISPIVFHAADVDRAYSILRDDKFKLSPTVFNQYERFSHSANRFFYLSTTRSRIGNFHLHSNRRVIFELDGRKLSQNMKGKPFNFFNDNDVTPIVDEMEDRIISDTPEIVGASRYIRSISLVGDHGDGFTVLPVARIAVKKRIPVLYYQNWQDFIHRRNSVSGTQFILNMGKQQYPTEDIGYDKYGRQRGYDDQKENKQIAISALFKLLRTGNSNTLSRQEKAIIDNLIFAHDDAFGELLYSRTRQQTLVKLMRQRGLRTLEDVRTFIRGIR